MTCIMSRVVSDGGHNRRLRVLSPALRISITTRSSAEVERIIATGSLNADIKAGCCKMLRGRRYFSDLGLFYGGTTVDAWPPQPSGSGRLLGKPFWQSNEVVGGGEEVEEGGGFIEPLSLNLVNPALALAQPKISSMRFRHRWLMS